MTPKTFTLTASADSHSKGSALEGETLKFYQSGKLVVKIIIRVYSHMKMPATVQNDTIMFPI